MSGEFEKYEVTVAVVYRNPEGVGLREMQKHDLFMAESIADASLAACRWVTRLFKSCGRAYEWLSVGAIQVHTYHISVVAKDGYCHSGIGARVMEWKCDTGLYKPMDKRVHEAVAEIKKLSPTDWIVWDQPASAEESEEV